MAEAEAKFIGLREATRPQVTQARPTRNITPTARAARDLSREEAMEVPYENTTNGRNSPAWSSVQAGFRLGLGFKGRVAGYEPQMVAWCLVDRRGVLGVARAIGGGS